MGTVVFQIDSANISCDKCQNCKTFIAISALTGGPLGSKRYCLNHVEMRWGGVDSRGSEHTVNGIGYSAEVTNTCVSLC